MLFSSIIAGDVDFFVPFVDGDVRNAIIWRDTLVFFSISDCSTSGTRDEVGLLDGVEGPFVKVVDNTEAEGAMVGGETIPASSIGSKLRCIFEEDEYSIDVVSSLAFIIFSIAD